MTGEAENDIKYWVELWKKASIDAIRFLNELADARARVMELEAQLADTDGSSPKGTSMMRKEHDLSEFLLARNVEDEGTANAETGTTRTRLLAECEAKRRIIWRCKNTLEEIGHEGDDWEPNDWEWFKLSQDDAAELLHILSLPYADHPRYREEWRP